VSLGRDLDPGPLPYQVLELDWTKYREYLQKNYSHHTMMERLAYAKKYYQVLANNEASQLYLLNQSKRLHVMKAIATLSKFLGQYDRWQLIRNRYNLKWTEENNFNFATAPTNLNLNTMILWLKEAYQKIPTSYGNILLFNTLTGLRPQETIDCIKLLKAGAPNYLNNNTLQHYKHPDIFIRRTKKAYISIINVKILELANSCGNHTYEAIRLYLNHRSISMNMAYCRKIYATYLRSKGVESEIIDILQG
jgi:hypothetical protein